MPTRSSNNKFNNKLIESHRAVQNFKIKNEEFISELKDLKDLKDKRQTLTSQQYNYFQKKIFEKYEEFNYNSLLQLSIFDKQILTTRSDIARHKLRQKFISKYLTNEEVLKKTS
jgi:GMP synthase PP-ATPase subunit